MDLELAGKRALVTGGNRGIGKAIARELAREGADVAIAARDQARIDATVAELAGQSGSPRDDQDRGDERGGRRASGP